MRYLILPLFLCACFEADQHVDKSTAIQKCRAEAERRAPIRPSETGNDLNRDFRMSLLTSCLEDKGYGVGADGEVAT